jgi:hypothetical protein
MEGTSSGPGAGWVMSYVEVLAAEYHMKPHHSVFGISLALGFALLDARACRMGANTIGYVERAIVNARARCERWLHENFEIVPTCRANGTH